MVRSGAVPMEIEEVIVRRVLCSLFNEGRGVGGGQ